MKKFVGLAILVVALFVGWRAWAVFHPAPIGGTPFRELAPSEQTARRADAQKAIQQVEEVAQSVKKGEKRDFELVFTQDQLNTLLQDRLQTENFPVKDLSAALEPGEIVLQGMGEYKGFSAPATLRGTLEVVGGLAVFRVSSFQIAGRNAPTDWKDKIERGVSEHLDKLLKGGKHAQLESIQIESGKMTIKGRTA